MRFSFLIFLVFLCLLLPSCTRGEDTIDTQYTFPDDRVGLDDAATQNAVETQTLQPQPSAQDSVDSWKQPYEEQPVTARVQDFSSLVFENTQADAICEKYTAVGAQVAVIEDGSVVGAYNFGLADAGNNIPVSADSKYRIASLTKLSTAIVCMQLVEQGKLSLDEDIGSYYGFTVRSPSYPDVPITLRMLMTHTSSLTDGSAFTQVLDSKQGATQSVLQSRSSFTYAKPGTVHSYSNLNFAVVGSVCEIVSGRNFEELAREMLFDPLGLECSYYAGGIADQTQLAVLYNGSTAVANWSESVFNAQPGQTLYITQGNLHASACDYAQLLCLLLNGGQTQDGTQLLSADSVNAICSVQYEDIAYRVGFGCFFQNNVIGTTEVLTHTGSANGMYAAYTADRATGNGVVVLTSGADYAYDTQTEIYSIALELIRLLWPTQE